MQLLQNHADDTIDFILSVRYPVGNAASWLHDGEDDDRVPEDPGKHSRQAAQPSGADASLANMPLV